MTNQKSYGDRAVALFLEGYNCAQSVFIAFAEENGMEKEKAAALSSPFGGGMGGMREVCGALSGSYMALGMMKGFSDTGREGKKQELYAISKVLAERFRQEETSIICREILIARHNGAAPHTIESPCAHCVRIAAENLANITKK